MSDFDAAVEEMVAMTIPREKAIAAARLRFPEQAKEVDATELRRADVLEKEEQLVVTKMARAIGFRVDNLSQARRTKQAPGLPDLWLRHRARKFAGWWETKRQIGGKRSSEQEDFAIDCIVASIPYGYGDRYEFARWLTANGFSAPPIPQD